MTTLITGAGLIGRLTAELLVARGDRVVLADIRDPGLALPFALCDVTNADRLDDIIHDHRVSRVVHTAAMLSTGIRANPPRGIAVNIIGTTNILDAARRHGLGRVVCASSSTVGYTMFGSHGPMPIEEDLPMRMLGERPASLYAASKIAGEHIALLYHDLYQVDVVMLRYAAVLGTGSGPASSVPSRLLQRLIAGGQSGVKLVLDDPFELWAGREEFVDARDCALANLAALDAPAPVQRVYNVANGDWFSLDDFVSTVRGIYPALQVEIPTPPGVGFAGFPHLRPAPSDISAAARELGFRARISLAETIAHCCTEAPS